MEHTPQTEGGTGMIDREKVIKGLEICSDCGFCETIRKYDLRCPYRNDDGKGCDRSQLLMDALALLNEQEEIIEQYHRADGFLAAHGWKWEGR